MTIPGFTADAALGPTGARRGAALPYAPQGDASVRPAIYPIDPPALDVSWQAGSFGRGTLTIKGRNFTPNIEAVVDADNCQSTTVRQSVITTNRYDYCTPPPPRPPRFCAHYGGGEFTVRISCACGGVASVRAKDAAGLRAQGSAGIPCG